MALFNRWTLVSITRGGGGGHQFDFIRRVFEVEESLVSPGKKTLRLKSCSNCKSVVSCSSGDVLTFGVRMTFSPSPKRVLAIKGRMFPVVRLQNARFVTRGK